MTAGRTDTAAGSSTAASPKPPVLAAPGLGRLRDGAADELAAGGMVEDLQLEGINSNNIATTSADTLFYAQAGLGLGPISLRANYRSIDTDFANGDRSIDTDFANGDWPGGTNAAGLSRNDTDRIFNPASAGTGFGVIASASLGIIGLNGYFDSKSDFFTLANPTTAFGVGAVLGPLAGFTATGYFNGLTVGGTAV